ncbi:MAG TPA: hypothetical protein VIL19_07285 [Casimicrobiaceae bacterium]
MKCASQCRDALAEVVFLDHAIRPDRGDELVLSEHHATMLNQIQQRVEHARGQWHQRAIAPPQPARGRTDVELSELVRTRRCSHEFVHNNSQEFIPIIATFTVQSTNLNACAAQRDAQSGNSLRRDS